MRNLGVIPKRFASKITPEIHRKSIYYTTEKVRLRFVKNIAEYIFLMILTVGGLLSFITLLAGNIANDFNLPETVSGVLLVGAFLFLSSLVEIPFSVYKQFVVEKKYGFSRMTFKLFVSDTLKSMILLALIGSLIMFVALLLISNRAYFGSLWWLVLWAFFTFLSIIFMVAYPLLIAPLFNTFSPLKEGELKEKLTNLLERCEFSAEGLFLMDGSKRSAHGNAFFAGFGKARRIVLFDTLVEKLSINEIEAVLAHELGHYKCGHVPIRIFISMITSFLFFMFFGLLIETESLFIGLGVSEYVLSAGNPGLTDAVFFILFFFVLPTILFPLQPLNSIISRKHEFEADSYAAKHSDANDLITALVNLYRDNASPVVTDKWFSLFYDSHPAAAVRIDALQSKISEASL